MIDVQFKTLVVGVDFSKPSKAAVHQAIVLSELLSAHLVFSHVTYLNEIPEGALGEKLKKSLEENLQSHFKKFYKIPEDLHYELVQNPGHPAEEIINIAKKYPHPLIILGNAGHNLLARLTLGSTAEQVAVTSPYPVWIHRGSKKVGIPKKALVPVDLSKNSQHLINWSVEFCQKMSMKVQGYFVEAPMAPLLDYQAYAAMEEALRKQNEARLKKFKAENANLEMKHALGDPATLIINHGKKFDLIIMSPHHRTKLFPTFGSVSAKVVRRAHCPVLTIR